MEALTYDIVKSAVLGGAAAFRARTRLQPAGGAGDKVFPPTFGDVQTVRDADGRDTGRRSKYALEWRRVDGASRHCVLLDSVASQANRMEEALLRAWDEGRLDMPMVRVDFTGATHEDPSLDLSTLGGDGYLTALEVPHRLADALIRDSLRDGVLFRGSKEGRAFTAASPHDATAVYALSPTALVFGLWDSSGPKGGQGAKYQRALVSEIVGVGVELGVKVGSRIDPAGVELGAGEVYEAVDKAEEWTLDPALAREDKKKPVLFNRKGASGKPGRPSNINHGNVTPNVESESGGVTLDYAEQVMVLSLPALRRLRFPKDASGAPVPRESRREAETAVRTTIATLGLAAMALQREDGFDLRSRCAFVPEHAGAAAVELVDRDGTVLGPYRLDAEVALSLVAQAASAAAAHGFAWDTTPIDLQPADKLVDLIRRSRAASGQGADEEA